MQSSLNISKANHFQRLEFQNNQETILRSMIRLRLSVRQLKVLTVMGHHSYRRLAALMAEAPATATLYLLRVLIWTILQVWTIKIRTTGMTIWAKSK